ncbi:MAG TPA: hypothetical protein VGP72_29065 [Planctomycetota bacterium]|jgi:hypothetical protein
MGETPRAEGQARKATAWHYGMAALVLAVQAFVLYWAAGWVVAAVSRKPSRLVLRDLKDGVLIRDGMSPGAPELVVDPFPEEPYEGSTSQDAAPLPEQTDGVRVFPEVGFARPAENEFRVDRNGCVSNPAGLSKFLQGSEKRELDNPPTFIVSARGQCKMGVMISKVNSWAEARLEFVVDGKPKQMPPLKASPGKELIDKLFELDIPRGEHRITVRNVGKDWASVAWYKFSGMLGD